MDESQDVKSESNSSSPEGERRPSVAALVRASLDSLSPSQRRVAEFITVNPRPVAAMSLAEVAEATGVSEATAFRLARSLGFEGFIELKLALAAESAVASPEAVFEDIEGTDTPAQIARKVIRRNRNILSDTDALLDESLFTDAVNCIINAQRVRVFGLGTSAPLAAMLRDRLFRIGVNVDAITDPYLEVMNAALPAGGDCVVAISRSGYPEPLVEAVKLVAENGATSIAITSDFRSPLALASDITLIAPSSEARTELAASPAAFSCLIEALYASIAMRDPDRTAEYQRRLWEANRRIARRWRDEERGLGTQGS